MYAGHVEKKKNENDLPAYCPDCQNVHVQS